MRVETIASLYSMLTTAAAQTVATTAGSSLTEFQLVVVAGAAGFAGGVLATLAKKGEISLREMVMRCLASTMIAPGITAIILFKLGTDQSDLVTISAALASGALAWPMWGIIPALAKGRLKAAVMEFFSMVPGDNK